MSANPLKLLDEFFGSWRFPIFALTLILGYEVMLLTLLLLPAGDGQVASFADEFRIWCFGYDPATGKTQWAYVLTTFTSPLIMTGVMIGVWIDPLRSVLTTHPRSITPFVGAAAAVVIGSAFCLTSFDAIPNTGELPFPAQALRMKTLPPSLVLTNQEGQLVDLSDYRGKVVILTAVYSGCGFTCPMIMGQARRVAAALTPEERGDLAIIGITLDPRNDTPERLANMAAGQQVSAPLFHLCTGEPQYVEKILDALEVQRRRDPETGVIDHANLFLLVDRGGRIAFRLTLGERQERWLESALALLLSENPTE
jgi:protein SCO1